MPQIANWSWRTQFAGVAVSVKITYHKDCHILKALIRTSTTPYYFHFNCQQGCIIKGIQCRTGAHVCALHVEFNLNIWAVVSTFVPLCTLKSRQHTLGQSEEQSDIYLSTFLYLRYIHFIHFYIFYLELCFLNWLCSRSHNYINKIQWNVTVSRCLFTAKLLYMFRVSIGPIIRSTSNCNCSLWYRS